MKILNIFILLLLFTSQLFADENAEMFKKANDFYKEGKFDEAVKNYEKVIANGFESSSLYYNLGNSYYKQNLFSKAILYYEKAKAFDPSNKDIAFNLELAQIRVVDKIDAIHDNQIVVWSRMIVKLMSSNNWAITSIVSFILFILLLSLFLFSRNMGLKKTGFGLGVAALIISVATFFFAMHQKNELLNRDTAIILSPTVTVKSSPDKSGTDLFILHEGVKVNVEDSVIGWKEIKIADGRVGWIESLSIESI